MNVVDEVIEPQLDELFNLIEAVDCLNVHKIYLREHFCEKSEFEKNKIRLEEIRTNLSILRIKKILKRSFKELQDSITIFEFALNECNDE